jgi:hypothetical protein
MSNRPTSFADWQNYPLTLDPIHVSWLKNAKINPLYHPASVLVVDVIPKLGSGKTDFGATKKIALVNDQK